MMWHGLRWHLLSVRRPKRDERGVNQSVPLALVTPVLLFAVLGIIQAGLWMHATTVATRAAQAGADAARSVHGSDGQAIGVATRIARSNGLAAIEASAYRDARQVTVVVRADAPLVLVPVSVEARASAPRERVIRP